MPRKVPVEKKAISISIRKAKRVARTLTRSTRRVIFPYLCPLVAIRQIAISEADGGHLCTHATTFGGHIVDRTYFDAPVSRPRELMGDAYRFLLVAGLN